MTGRGFCPGFPLGLIVQLLVHLIPLAKQGYVAALRQFEDYRIAPAFPAVILGEPRPKPACFCPHDGVELGIVIGTATEDLNGNHRFLDLAIPTR